MICQEETSKEFCEKNDGSIRLTLKITPLIAETVSLWSKQVDPMAGQVEAILMDHDSLDEQVITRHIKDEEMGN
jgi:hypothetical protein